MSVLSLITLPACCHDEASSRCGLTLDPAAGYGVKVPLGCTALEEPGNPDSTCPTLPFDMPQLMASVPLSGCCRPSGVCGVDGDLTNVSIDLAGAPIAVSIQDFGCVDPTFYVVDAGAPGSCTPRSGVEGGVPDAGGADAGSVSDAGAPDGPDSSAR